MSIFCTWFTLDDFWQQDTQKLGAPWVYQGSHVLPQETDPRGGSLDVSSIPNHIERDWAGPGKHDWLRLGVEGKGEKSIEEGLTIVNVILNRKQVEGLRDILDTWLKTENRE